VGSRNIFDYVADLVPASYAAVDQGIAVRRSDGDSSWTGVQSKYALQHPFSTCIVSCMLPAFCSKPCFGPCFVILFVMSRKLVRYVHMNLVVLTIWKVNYPCVRFRTSVLTMTAIQGEISMSMA
jgi:hypothetical protein